MRRGETSGSVTDPEAARTALITGVTGQDGVYLSHLLCGDGYRVIGTCRPGSEGSAVASAYLADVEVLACDAGDTVGFTAIVEKYRPDEIYNLAAFSSVGASWNNAEEVAQTNGLAVLRMLEALLRYRDRHGVAPRFYQASTSEMFGLAGPEPLTEQSPHHPRSPYAAAKSFAHHLTVNYRESYELFATNGILFNHESPLRGRQFVTRKITRAAAEIALGTRERVELGNLGVSRDWGAAIDYVDAMRLAMRADAPGDYIVATGHSHTLSDLLEAAFAAAGLDDPWQYVVQDPRLMRPADVPGLTGDATLAHDRLGWSPRVSFDALVAEMVRIDTIRVKSGVEESHAYLDD